MEYKAGLREDNSPRADYNPSRVHFWRPPCSCGVELDEALGANVEIISKEEVHFWRPPCSCGISLDIAVE